MNQDIHNFIQYLHQETQTSENTEVSYERDLKKMILYLTAHGVDRIDAVTPEVLNSYVIELEQSGLKPATVSRSVASMKAFFHYEELEQRTSADPAFELKAPKVEKKAPTILTTEQTNRLLAQPKDNSAKGLRDKAMLELLYATGIRVSECVGLDITDVDFRNNGIKVHRKGGAEVVVYFGDEVRTALLNYLEERNTIEAVEGSTNALFLSLQKKRIGVRAVENLVKKYSKLITTMKNITPHKLRSTYGTSLYRETGDIYLVADVLGHKDVNTTKKHYAALEDERRRTAPKYIHLRDE